MTFFVKICSYLIGSVKSISGLFGMGGGNLDHFAFPCNILIKAFTEITPYDRMHITLLIVSLKKKDSSAVNLNLVLVMSLSMVALNVDIP